MRFLYKVVLGLIIFNSMLLMLASFFPNTDEQFDTKNVTSDYSNYEIKKGGIDIYSFTETTVTFFGIGLALGGIGAWATKSTIPIAAGALGGLITGLYIGPVQVISDNFTQYTLFSGIISLIGVIIGILVGLTVLEWLANQQGVD